MADATPETAVGAAAGEASVEAAAGRPEAVPQPQPASGHRRARLTELPEYSRSLLRIRVPVVVTLAEKRQALSRIVELGAGSMIQFNRSCEEMLDLSVGGQRIATGEAVKVGDKFGLRITSIVLPEERFQPVRPAVAKDE
jgi:flagellar motor switch/type III secretory pathway protein FliN